MNTPAHLVMGLATLGRGRGRSQGSWIAFGTLLPDLPMVGFYIWQRLVLATPEATIWGTRYFERGWQNFFDLFNSIPLTALGLALALSFRSWPAIYLCAAMLLHFALDLPLHHDDGHGHLYPFSDWRFESPISYWDPSHRGSLGAGLELACVALASATLIRRTHRVAVRAGLVTLLALYTLAYFAFYWLGGL
jgi:hypothetical protein